MGTATLTYKCMEVAYMKVIYSSHATASKLGANELQSSVQMCPTGDSPLSAPASDLDTWNYKAKCVNTPQVAENYVVAATQKI
ncbi:hypothetical protein L2E82_06039 [Cichorium intybus]|uniref:Uncharacterized protein n=1 Tax=Cichorium intybus TaxID=13427 RepID=A0ACB9HA20_CICIN|nr:hypothetical protein L2E82_06039 [Cichorium intybus]